MHTPVNSHHGHRSRTCVCCHPPSPSSRISRTLHRTPSISPFLIFILCLLLLLIETPTLTRAHPHPPPLSTHQIVNTYLQAGGQAKIRAALNLSTHAYYNPLTFFTRDQAPSSHSASAASDALRDRASDLHILRLMGLHVPGIDSEESIHSSVMSRQSKAGCNGDQQRTNIPPATETLEPGHTRFQISYTPNTPADVEDVVNQAVRKWSREFASPNVVIRICFTWTRIDDNTLGATTTPIMIDGGGHNMLQSSSMYNPALAASLVGHDVIEPDKFHVHMTLNRDMVWHIDQGKLAPPDRFDLGSTVLHELTHGLFFSGTLQVSASRTSAEFQQQRPGRFDHFLQVEKDIAVAESCNGVMLYNAVRSPNLRFVDSQTGTDLGLYAPSRYAPGSSVYHFNNETIEADCRKMAISADDCSDLMTHELEKGYTRRSVGKATLRVYHSVRSRALGVAKGEMCNVPNYTVSGASTSPPDNSFKLPVWGIATVTALGVAGAVLLIGVIVSSVIARS